MPRSTLSTATALVPALLLPALLVLPAAPARAAQWRLAAFTGVGLTADSDLEIREPARGTDLVFRDVSFDDKSLEAVSAPYLGWRLTRISRRRPALAVAVELLHFKIFTETERVVHAEGSFRGVPVDDDIPMDLLVQQYDVANGVNLLMVDLLVRRAGLAGGRAELYAGLGAGPTIPYTKATVGGGGGDGQYELSQLGGQLLAGVLWQLSPRWDLFAEVKLTRTTVDGSFDGGESEVDLTTRHAAAGLGYRF
jgi:hypothetical protein